MRGSASEASVISISCEITVSRILENFHPEGLGKMSAIYIYKAKILTI